MSIEHTPAPWHVHPSGAQIVGGTDGMTSIVNTFATHWRHSAERASDERLKREFRDEHNANAHLIAAAPDLLDVARMVISLQEVGSVGSGFTFDDVVLRARAAIVKATGEARSCT